VVFVRLERAKGFARVWNRTAEPMIFSKKSCELVPRQI
jgi:hypothetical protein